MEKKTSAFKTQCVAKSLAPKQSPLDVASNPDVVRQKISEAAYFLAQKRGFTPGHEDSDWVEAERLLNQKNASKGKNDAVKKSW